jgi:hypothetical protein
MEVSILGVPDFPSIPVPTDFSTDFYYDYATAESAITLGIWLTVIIVILSIGAAVGLAFIPASIARKKGYSYGGFWAFGFFLFIPALIVALVIEDKTQPKYQQPYAPYPPGSPPYGQGYAPPQPPSYCPKCGAAIPAGNAFCQGCGTQVK